MYTYKQTNQYRLNKYRLLCYLLLFYAIFNLSFFVGISWREKNTQSGVEKKKVVLGVVDGFLINYMLTPLHFKSRSRQTLSLSDSQNFSAAGRQRSLNNNNNNLVLLDITYSFDS